MSWDATKYDSVGEIDWARILQLNVVRRMQEVFKVLNFHFQLVERDARIRRQQEELAARYSFQNIIGRSKSMRDLFRLIERVAQTEVPVLVEGESGTGKELVAKAIHYTGSRKGASFVAENCGALSGSLLESELFGHVKGAFTGAGADRKGLFELADGGTLFLDEIGSTSPEMQGKLVRVLEDGKIRPVGGEKAKQVDVRVIAASNKPLAALVEQGVFREDLHYRLNVVRIELPPLRQRREDIPLLAEFFLREASKSMGREGKRGHGDAGTRSPPRFRLLRVAVSPRPPIADFPSRFQGEASASVTLGVAPHGEWPCCPIIRNHNVLRPVPRLVLSGR